MSQPIIVHHLQKLTTYNGMLIVYYRETYHSITNQ